MSHGKGSDQLLVAQNDTTHSWIFEANSTEANVYASLLQCDNLLERAALDQASRYKLMASAITPRPIAWVTSQSAQGVLNAAPYSFFNMMGDAPPTIALGLLQRDAGGSKDTATNILETGEFVVNLVCEAQAEAMNITCTDAPPEVDELALAGLKTLPSRSVKPPRIAGCPASFECVTLHALETGPGQTVVIGQVLVAHIDDAFLLDPARLHIDTPAMQLIARMHGRGWYARSTDLFQIERPAYADLLANAAEEN